MLGLLLWRVCVSDIVIISWRVLDQSSSVTERTEVHVIESDFERTSLTLLALPFSAVPTTSFLENEDMAPAFSIALEGLGIEAGRDEVPFGGSTPIEVGCALFVPACIFEFEAVVMVLDPDHSHGEGDDDLVLDDRFFGLVRGHSAFFG